MTRTEVVKAHPNLIPKGKGDRSMDAKGKSRGERHPSRRWAARLSMVRLSLSNPR